MNVADSIEGDVFNIMTALETLTPSTVPAYLRDSEFGASLNYDDDEEFSVPIGVTKPTPKVDSLEDLSHFLATVLFWGLRNLLANLIRDCFTSDHAKVFSLFEQYSADVVHAFWIAQRLGISVEDQIIEAMSCGYLAFLQFLQTRGHPPSVSSIRAAIQSEQIECLRYALLHTNGLSDYACTAAVVGRKAACIEAILQCGPAQCISIGWKVPGEVAAPSYTPCDAAAFIGDIRYLEDARQHGSNWLSQITAAAASNGQLECLKYLRKSGCSWADNVVRTAVENKHFDCAAYALQNGAPFRAAETAVLDSIVEAGELRCLALISEDVHWMSRRRVRPCLLAALHSNLGCLIFLHEHQYTWDKTVTTAALKAGHYDCLLYAMQHGCVAPKRVAFRLTARGGEPLLLKLAQLNLPDHMIDIAVCAAANGYMNCLTHVVEHGCSRTATVCTATAAHSQLECLQYLHEQDFPWHFDTNYHAARNSYYNCLEYALRHGCAADVHTCEHLAAQGELRLLQLALRSTRCATFSGSHCTGISRAGCIGIMAAAARNGHLHCLQYLHGQFRFPVDKVVLVAAVSRSHWACVRYLRELGCVSSK